MTETPQGNMDHIPSYTIIRRQDLSFQFNPPIGSLELANALALKYPLELGLESQLRRALLDHLESEHNIHSPQASAANHRKAPTAWRITTGNPAEFKRKRSTFTHTKRKKVAEVRKRGACEQHRRKKIECNCTRPESTTRQPPEQVLDKSPASQLGIPESPTLPDTEKDFEGTYDFHSFLRNSTADPNWNDIFQPAPASYDPMSDPWWPPETPPI